MMIALHKQARTTPLIRAEIAASDEPVSTLMRRYGVTAATVGQWRHRTAFHDRSHTAQRLQTTLSPVQVRDVARAVVGAFGRQRILAGALACASAARLFLEARLGV